MNLFNQFLYSPIFNESVPFLDSRKLTSNLPVVEGKKYLKNTNKGTMLSRFNNFLKKKNLNVTRGSTAYAAKAYNRAKAARAAKGKIANTSNPSLALRPIGLISKKSRKGKDVHHPSQSSVKNTLSNFYSELNSLTYILETFFDCSIKLELNRLGEPYYESNIMAQLIGINGKFKNFEKIKLIYFPFFHYFNPNMDKQDYNKRNSLDPKTHSWYYSHVSGLKIKVAGRFYLHRIIPRKTVSVVQRGSLARGIVNLVEKARYTNKSKRGSFSVTV